MRSGRNLAICVLVVLFLSGCPLGIPPADPPIPKAGVCQIWKRVDDGPWKCYERGPVLRDLCKATACSQ
jgi:hypothetical protein